jgi:hypothetical protein
MQSSLRDIGADWVSDEADDRITTTILLIVPQGEDHTFGAMTVLGQLRRRGISVSLRIAPDLDEVSRLLQQRSFDGAMLSVGGTANLGRCRDLVRALKSGPRRGMRVAVGGAVLLKERNVMAATGADVATNDLTTALAAFGLTASVGAAELVNG